MLAEGIKRFKFLQVNWMLVKFIRRKNFFLTFTLVGSKDLFLQCVPIKRDENVEKKTYKTKI